MKGPNCFFNGLIDAAKRAGVDVVANRVGSMGTIFFTDKPVYDFNSAKQSDSSKYSTFYREMLAQKSI